jgi:uncharacterized protein YlxW (UPF0749 family)
MNVFMSGSRHQPWVWQVTGLCFILGVLVAASLQTVSNIRRSGGLTNIRPGQSPISTTSEIAATMRNQANEIKELRLEKTKLENSLATGDGRAKALNDELQKAKLLAGIIEVTGPGILLTLQDSKTGPPSNRQFEQENYIIHDVTLQRGLNELNSAGAEAISINGQRFISRTPIRCVGPTAIVNGVPLASPYEIRVIGDPKTLESALNLRGGYADWIRSYDPSMIKIERKNSLIIQAYSGSTDFRYAKPHAVEGRSAKPDTKSTAEKEPGAS